MRSGRYTRGGVFLLIWCLNLLLVCPTTSAYKLIVKSSAMVSARDILDSAPVSVVDVVDINVSISIVNEYAIVNEYVSK